MGPDQVFKPALTAVLRGVPDRDAVLARLAQAAAPLLAAPAEQLFRALLDREQKMPTSTPEGVAFPHALLPGVADTVVVAAAIRPGVIFRAGDHPVVDLAFGVFGASDRPWEHVRLLARLARLVRREGALERLRAAEDGAQLHERLVKEDHAVS